MKAGGTKGAHQDMVKKLEAAGHREVASTEQCDYAVVFCPGSDVDEAVKNLPGNCTYCRRGSSNVDFVKLSCRQKHVSEQ